MLSYKKMFLTVDEYNMAFPYHHKKARHFLILNRYFLYWLSNSFFNPRFLKGEFYLYSTFNTCFSTTQYPFRILYLSTQSQIDIVYGKPGFKCKFSRYPMYESDAKIYISSNFEVFRLLNICKYHITLLIQLKLRIAFLHWQTSFIPFTFLI